MASKKAMQKLVQDIYAARKRGDYDAMADWMTASGMLDIKGDPKLCAIAGKKSGREVLRKEFENLAQFAFSNQKMLSTTADGDKIAVHWRMKMTYRPNGKSATTEFCDLWTIKNGKVASLLQFVDTAAIHNLMA